MHTKAFSPSKNAAMPASLARQGFTLLELMIVVAVIAILAAIAVPSYESYIRKSRARTATADLATLSLIIENEFRRKLQYPKGDTANTQATQEKFSGWRPAMKDYFDYAVTFNQGTYQLKATGISGLKGCDLEMQVPTTLSSADVARKATGTCGFSTW